MPSIEMVSGPAAPPQGSGLRTACKDPGQLLERWQQHGDRAAREALVQHFMPLARSLARRYGHSAEPFEDLLQVASLGLLKALDRFDPSRGNPFASFAVPTILGEMRRHFRDTAWAVHVPRRVQERALQVREAQVRLTTARGGAPTVPQLAEYLELDTDEVLEALSAALAYEAVSLDSPYPGADEDAEPCGEALGQEDARYELVELDATVVAALRHLSMRERMILRLRFVDELTQTEIASRMGISQMQVSRLLRHALAELRNLAHASSDAP